jgi:hypothetical protein
MDNILDDINSGGGGASSRGVFCLSGTASDQGIVRNTVVTRTTNFWAGSCVESGGNVHRP